MKQSGKTFDITLAGEANLDLLLYGLPDDLPTDRELIASGMALTLGGSPAITAHNLAALGRQIGFITSTSNDLLAAMCLSDLTTAGVDVSRAVRSRRSTNTGISVLLQHPESRHTITYPGSTLDLRFEDLDLDYLTSARHFHLSSYFLQQGLRDDVPKLFSHLKRAGLTISVDPNDDPTGTWGHPFLETLPYVDVLMPNEREVCHIMDDPDIDRATRRLAELVPLLVVKQGARGAMAIQGSRSYPSKPVDVPFVDAIGAGDSFNAGFLNGFIQGWPLDRCLHFGNLTGSFSTTAAGGIQAFRKPEQIRQFLSEHEFHTQVSQLHE